jgi:hypothetical protein
MAAIGHCVFKKDENKTKEVSNYIGNKSCGCDTVRKLMHQTTQQVNKH